jgi:hypothetical protein
MHITTCNAHHNEHSILIFFFVPFSLSLSLFLFLFPPPRPHHTDKREQARKHTQQKSIAENQKKTIELAKASAQAQAHASQAQRDLASEDLKKLQEQTTLALKEKQNAEIDKVRERVAAENVEHRKASEQIEKERDHQANLAKGDEQARKNLVESIRSEQEAKKQATAMTASKVAEEAVKKEANPYEFKDVKFRHKGPLGLFFVPGKATKTTTMWCTMVSLKNGFCCVFSQVKCQ